MEVFGEPLDKILCVCIIQILLFLANLGQQLQANSWEYNIDDAILPLQSQALNSILTACQLNFFKKFAYVSLSIVTHVSNQSLMLNNMKLTRIIQQMDHLLTKKYES